ncbi:MAG: LysR family transcriptional regulator [Sutterella wadsworthensis]|nr:LysR family transcriptional regulator [Sutterella wadsworthensis]
MHPLPNLDFLRAFVAAADAKTIKGAAFDFDISPSAVSQAIAKLEGQIGQPVFVKHARPLRLTPVGARLLEEARSILQLTEGLLERVNGADLSTQKIRVGMGESVTGTISPWLITSLMAKVGQLETQTALSFPLIEMLRNDELEVVIAPHAFLNEERFVRLNLYEEEYLLVSNEKVERHPKAIREFAANHPFIGYTTGSFDEIQMERILRTLNIRPSKRVLVSSSYEMVGLIERINGWSLMTPSNLWCGRQFVKNITYTPMPEGHRHHRCMWAVGDRMRSLEAVMLTSKLAREIYAREMIPELASIAKGLEQYVTFPEN